MMCKRSFVYASLGVLAGLIVVITGGYFGANQWMVVENESPVGFEQTLAGIEKSAKLEGWQIPKVYRLCKSLSKHGHEVNPVAVVELCKPDYAAQLLNHDATRMVSSFMPCRVSVYAKDDGSVIISRMNTELMSHLFPDEVSRVMALASDETRNILDRVLLSSPETIAKL